MSSTPKIHGPHIDASLRDKLIAAPEVLLDDTEIMRALVSANERHMGPNVVDLRGIAMERLETRLDRLEDTHRSVIAAAYDNLAGTNQVHRAILHLLEPVKFDGFLAALGSEVADVLRVDAMRLILETKESAAGLEHLGEVLGTARPGFVADYLTRGRNLPVRQVTLRQMAPDTPEVYGEQAIYIRSEACLRLEFGEGRLPGLLALGAEDPHQFSPQQGTDLLTFFASAFERMMRRWIS